MRKRIWAIWIFALAVCFAALFFKPARQQEKAVLEKSDFFSNRPIQTHQQAVVEDRQQIHAQAGAMPPRNAAPIRAILAGSNAVDSALLSAWQAPIEFYGMVIDENSNEVAGATITFRWTESPTNGGNRMVTTQSDAYGLFSLHDQRGPNLQVAVQKEGYYASRKDNGSFNYGLGGNGSFSPDPANPVVFKLRKAGKKELLVKTDYPGGIGQIAQLRHDGTPATVNLLNGGVDQLKLEFWRDVSNAKANIFDWRCQLSISGGGLVEAPDEFAFQAPNSGYQSSLTIDMPAANQNWKGEIRNQYYVQLPDGNYGRVQLYLLSYNGAFTIESLVNPSGSQNLEPTAPTSQGRALPPGLTEVVPNFK